MPPERGLRFRYLLSLRVRFRTASGLGGHLKTGHRWSLQNRPTERTQNKSIYTLPEPNVSSCGVLVVSRHAVLPARDQRVGARPESKIE